MLVESSFTEAQTRLIVANAERFVARMEDYLRGAGAID